MNERPTRAALAGVCGLAVSTFAGIALLCLTGAGALTYALVRPSSAPLPTLRLKAERLGQSPGPSVSARLPTGGHEATVRAASRTGLGERRVRLRPTGQTGPDLELFGIVFFLGFLLLEHSSRFGDSARTDRYRRNQFWLAIGGVAGVFWALYQISFRPRHLGPEHIIASACVVTLFILSAGGTKPIPALQIIRHWPSDFMRLAGSSFTWAIVSSCIAVAWLASTGRVPSSSYTFSEPEFFAWYKAQPRAIELSSTEAGTVTIVEFTDFECPACKVAHSEIRPGIAELSREFGERLKYVQKDYPLDPSCNEFVTRDLHLNACAAAVAVRLARDRGRAEPLLDWIWNNQHSLNIPKVFAAAEQIAGVTDGMSRYDFVLRDVVSDIRLAHSVGVTGTPTFFVNGVKLPRLPLGGVREALQQAALYELEPARVRRRTSQ